MSEQSRWRAQALVEHYKHISGPYYDEPPQTVVEDILADLLAWAMHRDPDFDFVKACDMAEIHYTEENEL